MENNQTKLEMMLTVFFILYYVFVKGKSSKKEFKENKIKQIKDMKRYYSKDGIILSKHMQLDTNSSLISSNFVIACGGSGRGKSSMLLCPSLLLSAKKQNSVVVTDAGSVLYDEFKDYYLEHDYIVKNLNLFSYDNNSNNFNPLWYIPLINSDKQYVRDNDISYTDELDDDFITSIVNTFIGEVEKEDYWLITVKEIFKTLIMLVCYNKELKSKRTLVGVAELISLIFIKDEKGNTPLDKYFDAIESDIITLKEDDQGKLIPDINQELPVYTLLLRWRQNRNQLSGDSNYIQSVQGSVVSYTSRLLLPRIKRLMTPIDNMEIDKVGQKNEKIIWFIRTKETSINDNWITSLFYMTLLNIILINSSKNENGRLDNTAMILMEEAGSTYINGIERIVSQMRKRNVNILMCLQSAKSQLEKLYGKEATKTILSNISTHVFLGNNDIETLEYYSQLSGNKIISLSSESRSAKNVSRGESESIQPLLSFNELRKISKYHMYIFMENGDVFLDQGLYYKDMDEYKKHFKK